MFSKITAKKNLGSVTIFEGMVVLRSTKMNKTFSVVNRVPNNVYNFFPRENPYRLNESQKTGFGGAFSPISVVLSARLFPKTIEFTHGWIRTNYVNFMKIGSKLRPVSHVLVYKYIYTRLCVYVYLSVLTLRICDEGLPKWKSWPPPLAPSEVEGFRIVVILFRKIAKKTFL